MSKIFIAILSSGLLPARREADAKRPKAGLVFALPVPALALPRFRFYGFDLSRHYGSTPWLATSIGRPGGSSKASGKATDADQLSVTLELNDPLRLERFLQWPAEHGWLAHFASNVVG